MDILLYKKQSSSVFRRFKASGSNKLGTSTGKLQLEIPLDHLTNFGSTVDGTA